MKIDIKIIKLILEGLLLIEDQQGEIKKEINELNNTINILNEKLKGD